jgi:hypothetical protein
MLHDMTAYAARGAHTMRHDPAGAAIVIMLRSLKMPGMAQAVQDLMEQGAPAFDAAVPILSQLLERVAINWPHSLLL